MLSKYSVCLLNCVFIFFTGLNKREILLNKKYAPYGSIQTCLPLGTRNRLKIRRALTDSATKEIYRSNEAE